MSSDSSWGADAPITLPMPLGPQDDERIEMEGFCFTATGLKVSLTEAESEDILFSGYGPRLGDGLEDLD